MTAVPLIGFGKVSHTRVRPTRNAFIYPTYFLMLPMRTLGVSHGSEKAVLALNRRAALSFYDCDHGDGRSPEQGGALAWLDELLVCHGIADATGETWLHCYPRVFGYTFKPVSFWYCHDPAGALRAIVVEVNNTAQQERGRRGALPRRRGDASRRGRAWGPVVGARAR